MDFKLTLSQRPGRQYQAATTRSELIFHPRNLSELATDMLPSSQTNSVQQAALGPRRWREKVHWPTVTQPWRRGETGSEGSRQSPRTLVKSQGDRSPQQPAPWDAGWASQACPLFLLSPTPAPRSGLSVRPGSLLRSLTHDEPPVRSSSTVSTGPDLGSDSYSSLGAATSSPRPALRHRLGLWLQTVSLEAGSASNFHVGPPGRGGARAAATARWKPRPERPRRRFRRNPRKTWCRYCGSHERKKDSRTRVALASVFLKRSDSEAEKLEFSF